MLAYRSPSRRLKRSRGALLAGALGSAVALILTSPGTAAAAPPSPDEPVRSGQAWMGAGTRIEQGLAASAAGGVTPMDTSGVQGIDVSHWQGSINWGSVKAAGIDFAYMKATEGTSFKDSSFNANYTGSYNAGLIRGAYHFARPNVSNGATQAGYFASNGGGWSKDGKTLPGVLDIEHNPYGAMCYGLSTTQMRTWINDFYNTYKARTTRDVVIYTTASWWNTCTGSWTGMSAKSPLGGPLRAPAARTSRPASPPGRSGSTRPPAGSAGSPATWTATSSTAVSRLQALANNTA
ncbi:lysozyme [Streptomyces] [Streptomyces griseus]